MFFKVKVYKVYPKNNPDLWYLVDAPSAYIARWCGAAILNNDYCNFLSARHMKAKVYKYEE